MPKFDLFEAMQYIIGGLISFIIFLFAIIGWFVRKIAIDIRDNQTRVNDKVENIDDRLIRIETVCVERGKNAK